MGENTTIDSLQIEIQSNSTNAARGIDSLAASLEKLKKNGSFKTVSTNLNHLSNALSGLPNVHQASNSLRTLANSIEKLKGVGTVSSLVNSLKKLPDALKSLESINLGRAEITIRGLVDAVSPLAQVKSSGFSSMVNSMKKLKDVTESLDTETLDKFAEKVKRLNEIVEPFATKMGTIKSALSGINTQIKQTNVSIDKVNEEVNVSIFNISNLMNVLSTVHGVLQQIVQTMADIIHQATEWDGIAARFGRGFGSEAQETYEWVKRLNEEMGINIQQFMQYSSVYATMLTGFGVANQDATKMALGYTELTYDIWAGYNDIYQTFDEAAEAVRSAIAGEVEPVRRAGFTIIESILQQTAANHGLEVSIENATEAQKSYLRYLTLVDQAHAQGLVGTYAKEMNTAEGLLRTLSQQFKSLTQSIGSLFIPILVKALPWLQAFVELLTEGVYWLANLIGIEIQQVDFSGYDLGAGAIDNVANSAGTAADALGDATKAAKELKNATLGIDELNVISPTSATSGTGGSVGSGGGAGSNGFTGLDVDSLWDETIFDTIQSDVDAIKEKIKGWLPAITTVATALGGLRLVKFLKDINAIEKTKLFAGKIKGLGGLVDFFKTAKQMAPEVGWLAALFPKLSTAIAGVATALGGLTLPAWAGIAAAIVAIGSAIYFVVKNWDELKQAVKDFFAENIAPKLEEIVQHFGKIAEALGPVWTLLKTVFGWIVDVGLPAVGKAFEWLGGIVVGIAGGVIGGAINGIVSVIEGAIQTFSGVVQIVRGVIDMIIAIFTEKKISDGWKKTWAGIVDTVKGIYDATIGAVVELVEGIIDWFTKMWDILVGHSIVPDTINAIVDWFTSLPGKIFGSVSEFVSGIVGKFKDMGKRLSDGLASGLETASDIWGKIKNWCGGIVDKVKELFGIHSPSKVFMGLGGNLSDGLSEGMKSNSIKDKLLTMWTNAKNWWNDKKGTLKSYTPSIGSVYDTLKSRWDSARTWWNEKKSAMKSYTPSIGSIYEKVSDRWKNAREWWNSKKGSFKSYTPSIGSIVDKVKSAWNSAKSWWSKNVGGLSTKLNISVPKLTVNWGEVSALGKTFKYPKSFSVKFAADGGIFDQGSLIWAGERGPEVMATAAGGKTGVMNVDQMQEAVYEGVYAAVVAAMRMSGGNGSNRPVQVVLPDGRVLASSVEKAQSERGASIMGNEVYAY